MAKDNVKYTDIGDPIEVEIPGSNDIFRIQRTQWADDTRSGEYINMRRWYKDKNDGTYKPTQKGMSVPAASLASVITALSQV